MAKKLPQRQIVGLSDASVPEVHKNAIFGSEGKLRLIFPEIDSICESAAPLRHRDSAAISDDDISSLAQSIREYGLQQPIVLQSMGDKFVLVAGERRLRAYRYLRTIAEDNDKTKWDKISAILLDDDRNSKAYEISLVENAQRSELTLMELVGALDSLKSAGKTGREIGVVTGLKEDKIYALLSIGKLPDAIKREHRDDIASASLMIEFAKLTGSESQIIEIWEMIKSGKIDRKTLREINEEMRGGTYNGYVPPEARAIVPLVVPAAPSSVDEPEKVARDEPTMLLAVDRFEAVSPTREPSPSVDEAEPPRPDEVSDVSDDDVLTERSINVMFKRLETLQRARVSLLQIHRDRLRRLRDEIDKMLTE